MYAVTESGETIYGAYFGHAKEAWCTEFVLWCLIQADNDMGTEYVGSLYPYSDYSGGCVSRFKKWERFHYANSDYIPRRGDMIFFKTLTTDSTDHTGFVIGTTEEDGNMYVLTIEGNIPTDEIKVIRHRKLLLSESIIYGYGTPFEEN